MTGDGISLVWINGVFKASSEDINVRAHGSFKLSSEIVHRGRPPAVYSMRFVRRKKRNPLSRIMSFRGTSAVVVAASSRSSPCGSSSEISHTGGVDLRPSTSAVPWWLQVAMHPTEFLKDTNQLRERFLDFVDEEEESP
jgi:hypothetical protein